MIGSSAPRQSSPHLSASTAWLAALLVGIAGALAAPPEKPDTADEPGGLLGIWDPRTSPFIPIPEVGTDPNSGTTTGLLTVFLTTENGQVTRILAPDVIYNPNLGYGANYRILAYPSEDRQWSVVAGAKQRVERGVDGVYSSGILRQSDWSYFTHVLYDRSATERFFGFGNASSHAAQSNYTNEQASVEASVGRNFGPNLQVALNLRPRFVQVERGRFSTLPSTNVAFPGLQGLGGTHEFLSRLFVSYDTRDSPTIPTQGTQLVAFGGFTDKALLSSVSYSRFGVDARHFEPLNERFTLAGHVALQYMPVGNNTPFWALSSLGGDRSVLADQQPLRGFGSDRFIDRNSFSSTIELRSKIFDIDLFSTSLTFEMAPFVDAGRVFHELDDNPVAHLHVAGGLGFRAIAKPFIVGYVDIGYGSEGTAIFSGINYPF